MPTHKSLHRGAVSFDPELLDKAVIAIPLLRDLIATEDALMAIHEFENTRSISPGTTQAVAIELNPQYADGLGMARESVRSQVGELIDPATVLRTRSSRPGDFNPDLNQYVLAVMTNNAVEALKRWNEEIRPRRVRPILQILPPYPKQFAVVIDLNLEFQGGREAARQAVLNRLSEILGPVTAREIAESPKNDQTGQYLFARLSGAQIRALIEQSGDLQHRRRAIFRIWPDFEVRGLIRRSVATIKADAALNSFSATGEGITWAVIDSGIDKTHPHFQRNFDPTQAHFHADFTESKDKNPFSDENGHGTHVAGIIAGEPPQRDFGYSIVSRFFKPNGDTGYEKEIVHQIRGTAPKCRLVSLKVLDGDGDGAVSNIIAAIAHIQKINSNGRRLLIQGANISLGYTFEPEWFACGQSPLCVEVDRLAKSGVAVVVAAGNTGYGTAKSAALGATPAGLDITINDPGNANLAITVGSTHRDMPHVYGVSYFSSKGPTGDGRLKPDLVAPGEKIMSCACGRLKVQGAGGQDCDYVETSGTSMAAAHVSGAIAAFLSIRREFIGRPEEVKRILVSTATDLGRERYFQGSGLVDLMRAIQSV